MITTSSIAAIINGGIQVKIPKNEMIFTRRLEAQIPIKKAIYGGGFLCSDRIAEELKAEKLKAEKLKQKYKFNLSENEKNIIAKLN